MVLGEVERQQGATRIRNRLISREYSLARLIAESRTGIDSPCCLILAVDRILDRASHPAPAALVIENGRQRSLRRAEVSGGFGKLHFLRFLRSTRWRGFHFEFGESASSFYRAPRPAQRQVGIGQELQPKRRDVLHVSPDRHLDAMLRRGVTRRQERSVLQRQVFLPACRDVLNRRSYHSGRLDLPSGPAARASQASDAAVLPRFPEPWRRSAFASSAPAGCKPPCFPHSCC